MKALLASTLAFFLPVCVSATSVEQRPLDDLVRDSDHVLMATVTKVDMIDGNGKEVTDRNGMTGPGLENEIRFHLHIQEILFSSSPQPPKQVVVRLWKAWHYALGDIQYAVVGQTSIFLLKGNDYEPVYPADFQRALQEREQIQALVKRKH